MASSKPTVVVIGGAWHIPFHYDLLKKRLEALGYPAVVPHLQTCNNATPSNKSLEDDVAQVRKVVTDLIAEKKSVIGIMHSYGGMVGTEALHGLGANPSAPQEGGVVALIYMCAFFPFEGQSLVAMLGQAPPFLTPEASTGHILVSTPGEIFYSGLSPADREPWIKELVFHPFAAHNAPVTNAAWRGMSGRTWYLVCEEDQAIPVVFQDAMIQRVMEEKIDVKVERCGADHSPFIGMIDSVTNVIDKAAAA